MPRLNYLSGCSSILLGRAAIGEPTVRVQADIVTERTAEQIVDRPAEGFALKVPECDVNARERS